MKKWLDDLYAILLKRGFHTLDNSLKNYDTFDKQISKEVQSGSILAGETITYDLSNYEAEIKDLILVKCIFNDSKLAIFSLLKISINYYSRVNNFNVNSSIKVSISGPILTITNETGNDLQYSLNINVF